MEADTLLVNDYLKHYHSHGDGEEYSWAFDELYDIVRKDCDRGWILTLMLLDATDETKALAYIAAGPLEDLLDKHGEAIWPKVLAEVENNKKLQFALSCVWLDDDAVIIEKFNALSEKYELDSRNPLDGLLWDDEIAPTD